MNHWLQTALRPDVRKRSLRVAVIVGTIVVLINYLDRFIAGRVGAADYLKIALTYCVPYCVATYAAVGAILHKEHGG